MSLMEVECFERRAWDIQSNKFIFRNADNQYPNKTSTIRKALKIPKIYFSRLIKEWHSMNSSFCLQELNIVRNALVSSDIDKYIYKIYYNH